MRRIAFIMGMIAAISVAGVLVAIVWIDQALATAPRSPVLCMTPRDRERIAAGRFPSDRQDSFVAKSLNFDQGVPRTITFWHLRGAAIQLTYVSFWSADKRGEIFSRLASQMRDCRPD